MKMKMKNNKNGDRIVVSVSRLFVIGLGTALGMNILEPLETFTGRVLFSLFIVGGFVVAGCIFGMFATATKKSET